MGGGAEAFDQAEAVGGGRRAEGDEQGSGLGEALHLPQAGFEQATGFRQGDILVVESGQQVEQDAGLGA